jgi:hypothetical protein
MNFVFTKILAGEVRKPGSFSKRTIRVLSQLDYQSAMLFRKLCSMAIKGGDLAIDVRVSCFGLQLYHGRSVFKVYFINSSVPGKPDSNKTD